jgi:hypothetical protein
MKIRTAFVSNSSSSSYVIVSKTGLRPTDIQLSEAIAKCIPSSSGLSGKELMLARILLQKQRLEEIALDDYVAKHGYHGEVWEPERSHKIAYEYARAYSKAAMFIGFVGDQEDGRAANLCKAMTMMDFNTETANLIIGKEGGY